MKRWLKASHWWSRARKRVRGVRDGFTTPSATPKIIFPLRNDQGANLRITHINNVPAVLSTPIDLGDYTVTLGPNGQLTVAAQGGWTGDVAFRYYFTDGRTSGAGEVKGEFT